MDDEILDVVNEFDEVIGTVNRRDYDSFCASKRGYIRAVDMFIMNDEGQLWVPVRTADKTIAPNGYDYAVGGHVGAGEEYKTALFREAEEEIGLQLGTANVEFVGKVKATAICYIRSIYLLRTNETPTFNPHDFVSANWITPEELLSDIQKGHPAKGNIPGSLALVQLYLANKL